MQIFIKLVLGTIVSFYLFPFGLTFIPAFINTKMVLAILGVVAFCLDNFNLYKLKVNLGLLTSGIIAVIFSFICYYSTVYNNTIDYSYATYVVSFFVWLFGAYFVCFCFRLLYDVFSFRQLVYYLLGVCVTQCTLALLIDNLPFLKNIVDSFVLQGQEFLNEIGRLYGIGASLDPAGMRFSVVLVLAAALITSDEYTKSNSRIAFLTIFAFFFVGVIGNMISRTTVVGFSIGFLLIIFYSGIFRQIIKVNSLKTIFLFFLVLIFIVSVAIYLYQTSVEYRESFRFAFEGFFNYVETGEWRTDSTDKLNNEMWVWPEDTKTWIIGTGLFDNFIYSTDVGYCRFILYCGLVGFIPFALLFVSSTIFFILKVPHYRVMFLIFGILPFVFWLKVATDIFFIFALLYCIDSFSTGVIKKNIISNENSI